jgi:hypothetical protein
MTPSGWRRVLTQRYSNADAGFAAGSLVRGDATETSDLDLVVLFSRLPNAYRESFVFDGTPVDASVHDPETLRAFFGKDIDAGKSGMLTMVVEGRIVGSRLEPAERMKAEAEAEAILARGPRPSTRTSSTSSATGVVRPKWRERGSLLRRPVFRAAH